MASGPSLCFHWEQPSRMDRTRRSRRTRSSRSASAGVRPSGSPTIPRSARWFCHHFHTASPATAPASRAPFPSARRPSARSSSRSRALAAQGLGRIVLVNSHFEPEQVRTLRGESSRRAGADRTSPRPHSTTERRAADRGVPLRVVPRRPLRNVARPRRSTRARPRGAHGGTGIDDDRHAGGDRRRTDRLHGNGNGSRLLRLSCGGDRRGGRADVRDARGHAGRARPRRWPRADVRRRPTRFNLASYFVDRNVEEGRGGRAALIAPDGSNHVRRPRGARQPERPRPPRARRPRRGARAARPCRRSRARSALVRSPEDRRRDRRGYTFLQSKDYAYYLDYTRAGVVVADETTLDRVERLRDRARGSGMCSSSVRPRSSARARSPSGRSPPRPPRSSSRLRPRGTTSRSGSSRRAAPGLPKAAVHPQHSPLLSFDWYARGVLGVTDDDVVLPVPKLFFGYARDLAALYPLGVGGAGIVFPERTTPGANLRARRAAPAQHPRSGSDDDGGDDGSPRRRAAGSHLPPPLHVSRRGASTRAVRALAGDLRVEVLDGIGSSEAYHIYISNRPGNVRPGSVGQPVPGYSCPRRRRGRRQRAGRRSGDALEVEGDRGPLLLERARSGPSRPSTATP